VIVASTLPVRRASDTRPPPTTRVDERGPYAHTPGCARGIPTRCVLLGERRTAPVSPFDGPPGPLRDAACRGGWS
jgi:hypothetical protein